MFCPKCSANTGDDDARYCRSCGLRLDIVALLMTRNGEPESFAPATMPPPVTTVSTGEKGLRSGGKMLFFSLLTLPFIFAFVVSREHMWWYLIDHQLPSLIAATVFFMGVMRMLYAWLFADPIPAASVAMPTATIVAGRPVSALPGVYQQPVVHISVPNTSNVNQPSSVTEPTTNLLGRQ